MDISILLHFYQPINQQEDILTRIIHESYIPLIKGFKNNPKFKATFNISGVLLNIFKEHGYRDILDDLSCLVMTKQVELVSSAMYHPILPLLAEREISRQLDIHEETCRTILSSVEDFDGFFPPEMAVSEDLFHILAARGISWVAVPELAASDINIPLEDYSNFLFVDTDTNLKCLFRNKRISSLILSGVCRSAEDLIHETSDLHQKNSYWFAVMDAETFGHHRIGHQEFLFDLLSHKFFESHTSSELINKLILSKKPVKTISIRPCTWTNVEQDFWLDNEKKIKNDINSFILWKDPGNPIHTLQWDLVDYILGIMDSYKNKNDLGYLEARKKLDSALASDQFWWASAKPWWSLEMIEQGAYQLKSVVSTLQLSNETMTNIDNMYRSILDKAFEWQRTGYIRKAHLKASSTFMSKPFKERAPEEWFNQIVLEFEDQMNIAASKQDYEKAIKWRDALIKLKQGSDIYDILHVVDELWTARSIPSVKPIMQHTWNELSDFSKKFFIGINGEKEFEEKKKLTGSKQTRK